MKDIRLSSKPIQAVNQEEEERVSIMPRRRVDKNKIRDGWKKIKTFYTFMF